MIIMKTKIIKIFQTIVKTKIINITKKILNFKINYNKNRIKQNNKINQQMNILNYSNNIKVNKIMTILTVKSKYNNLTIKIYKIWMN